MPGDRIARTYLAITFLFNLAMALIWGINTLFLMDAGLDILQVMLVNTAFTLASSAFEVPTGVIADTLGRRASLLLCLATLFVGTLGYVGIAWMHGGFWWFTAVSVVLGLGFTFYSGAVEAWAVDAMAASGGTEPLEPLLSRGEFASNAAMLIGTLAGGILGQVHLYLPYVVRAALVVPLFAVAFRFMKDVGFTPRALELARVPAEMRRVFLDGLRHGVKHPVLRPVMLAMLVNSAFLVFGFYSWQPYFLELLGHDAVWVAGAIASALALAMMAGNALVEPLSRHVRTRSGLMMGCIAVQAALIFASGSLHEFAGAVSLYLLYGVAVGVATPVRQAYLNSFMPSAQRATLISLASLFASLGGAAGQSGFGWVARVSSIATAWRLGGLALLLGIPLWWLARRADRTQDAFQPEVSVAGGGGAAAP
jgi:MFS family permease